MAWTNKGGWTNDQKANGTSEQQQQPDEQHIVLKTRGSLTRQEPLHNHRTMISIRSLDFETGSQQITTSWWGSTKHVTVAEYKDQAVGILSELDSRVAQLHRPKNAPFVDFHRYRNQSLDSSRSTTHFTQIADWRFLQRTMGIIQKWLPFSKQF